MVAVSKRLLYGFTATITAGAGLVAVALPETVVAELASPATLLLVLLLPGLLGYLGLTKKTTIDRRAVTYAVGLSAALLMGLGALLNLTHLVTSVEPLRPFPVWLAFSLLLGLLGFGVDRRVPGDRLELVIPGTVRPYLLVAIPIAAGGGSLLVEGGWSNWFVLLTLIVIALVYTMGAVDPSHRVALLYCVALGLLLHNTLISEFLLWGDQGKEANLVYTVLQAGYWDPAMLPRANKAVMLEIVILHPVRSLLTGLGVNHLFKIAHPLVFAVAPVALYQTFALRDRARAGYLAAGAVMFFFSFFTVLARNTRTAIAILFIVLFMMALLDTEVAGSGRGTLLSVFGIAVFVSHYGAGYMFLATVMGGLVVGIVGRKIIGQRNRAHEQLPVVPVVLIVIANYAWYTYVPPNAATLNTLVGFFLEFSQKLQSGFFQPTNSATANYAASSFSSISLNGIKALTVVLFALIGLGWLTALARSWRGETGIETNVSYLGLASIAGALAAITFLPVERFNTARTIAVSLAVVAPLFAIGVEGVLSHVPRSVSVPDWTSTAICLAVLLPFFAFSSGLLAATATNDYSPNVLVYRDSVVTDGSPASQSYLYKQYLPDTGARGGQWLASYGTGTIFGSQWPGNPTTGTVGGPSPQYEYRGNITAAPASSCIYLSPLSVDAGVIRLPAGHFENEFMQTSELDLATRSRVYANGGATLRC